jgi:hypothetical protein
VLLLFGIAPLDFGEHLVEALGQLAEFAVGPPVGAEGVVAILADPAGDLPLLRLQNPASTCRVVRTGKSALRPPLRQPPEAPAPAPAAGSDSVPAVGVTGPDPEARGVVAWARPTTRPTSAANCSRDAPDFGRTWST